MLHDVEIIGVPVDFGGNRRGVDMGPSAVRYAGLEEVLEDVGMKVVDGGDITVPERELSYGDIGGVECLRETEKFSRELADRVESVLSKGRTPLVVGGDHSTGIGCMNGSSREGSIGVIWFDAHGDINTPESSPSGNIHGMPVAAALGYGQFGSMDWARANLSEENLVYVGIRDLDEPEKEVLREKGVTVFTISDIDERGIVDVVHEAVDTACEGTEGVHVSVDMDWIDPEEAPGVGTPVPGGVTYREAHKAMEIIAERDARDGFLRSVEIAEVNPILDRHNVTAELAGELAASIFGKKIL